MANNLQYSHDDEGFELGKSSHQVAINPNLPLPSAWHIKLGLGQTLLLTTSMSVIIIAAALSGFYLGRNRGIDAALTTLGDVALSTPIPATDASSAKEIETAKLPLPTASELEFAAGIPTSAPSSLAAKPALELFKDEPESDRKIALNNIANNGTTKLQSKVADQQVVAASETNLPKEIKPETPSTPVIKDITTAKKPNTESATEYATGNEMENETGSVSDVQKVTISTPSFNTFAPAPGWYVQVAAAKSEREAESITKRVSNLGLNSKVEVTKVGDKTFYRVLLGSYSDKRVASAVQERIRRARVTKGQPFLKQVR